MTAMFVSFRVLEAICKYLGASCALGIVSDASIRRAREFSLEARDPLNTIRAIRIPMSRRVGELIGCSLDLSVGLFGPSVGRSPGLGR